MLNLILDICEVEHDIAHHVIIFTVVSKVQKTLHFTLKIWKQNIFNYVEALIKCKLKKSSNVMFWLTFVQSDCSRRSLDITARDLNERERTRNEKEKRKWKNYRWCRLQIFLNYKLRKFRSIYPILVTNVLSRIHEFFLVVNNNLSLYIEKGITLWEYGHWTLNVE